MAREVYDCQNGVGAFSKAGGNEDTQYDMPEKAYLDLRPASDYAAWVAESGISFILGQDPPTTQFFSGPVLGDRHMSVDDFPPEGANYFNNDGSTLPENLRELIKARVGQGWTMSPALEDLLAQG